MNQRLLHLYKKWHLKDVMTNEQAEELITSIIKKNIEAEIKKARIT